MHGLNSSSFLLRGVDTSSEVDDCAPYLGYHWFHPRVLWWLWITWHRSVVINNGNIVYVFELPTLFQQLRRYEGCRPHQSGSVFHNVYRHENVLEPIFALSWLPRHFCYMEPEDNLPDNLRSCQLNGSICSLGAQYLLVLLDPRWTQATTLRRGCFKESREKRTERPREVRGQGETNGQEGEVMKIYPRYR